MVAVLNFEELKPPDRILMGPGPSNVPDTVYRALSATIIGHLDLSMIRGYWGN